MAFSTNLTTVDWGKIGKMVASTPQQGGQNNWQKAGSVVNSQGFGTAVGAVGAYLQGSGNNRINAQNQQQSAAEFAASMALRQQEGRANRRLDAATAAANASPLGANENFALRQGLMRSIMPGLRNANYAPGDAAVRSAMGSGGGGFRLPEGGIPASALASLSPEATAGAIGQRQQHITNIDPNAPGINLERMGLPNAAVQGETDAYQAKGKQTQVDADSATAAQLQAALSQDYGAGGTQGKKKKGGGILSKLGSIAKVVVPVVLAATGVGAPAAAAWMAGTYAADKKAKGGSWGDALKSGVVGGATGAIGAGAAGAAKGAAGAGTKAAFTQAGKQAAVNMGAGAAQGLAQQAFGPSEPQQAGVDPRLLQQALRKKQFGG